MDHIQDVYKKKPDMINKIWDHLTKVNLKVDGKPFQVVYNEDEDELEYHGRSGNETKVGPLIDDMYRLFSKPINDAIRHIENRVEVFKRYKFLTFEVIDEILLLTAIITKEGKFVDDPDEIDEIAKELDTDVMPCLWKGKLSDEQRDILMTAISTDIIPTKDDFVKWVKDLFGTYKKFPKTLISRSTEFIEGIVFFYDVDGKVVEYKLVDPSFRQMVKDNHANMKQDGIENAEKYTEIYTSFLNWAEENAKGLDKNRMRSIEFNFIEMMKDPKIYNKLMKDGAGLTTITTDAYFLQPDRISDELKKAIKKHGKVYQLLYEKFVRLFYKAKKRGFVLSKEFQARVNKAVDKFADYSLNEDEIEINGEKFFESSESKTKYDHLSTDINDLIKQLNLNSEYNEDELNLIIEFVKDVFGKNKCLFTFAKNNRIFNIPRQFADDIDILCKDKYKDKIESKQLNGTSRRISLIEGNKYFCKTGNGSLNKISTTDQELATCKIWNHIALNQQLFNEDGIDSDLIKEIISDISDFSDDWIISFNNQILSIKNYLEHKVGKDNIWHYRAVRYGQSDNNISKIHKQFLSGYLVAIKNEYESKENILGKVSKDNYDPADILLYKINDKGEPTESIKYLKLLENKKTLSEKFNAYLDAYKNSVLIGVSLKQALKINNFEEFNCGDIAINPEHYNFNISKVETDKYGQGARAIITGSFDLMNISDPENPTEEIGKTKALKMIIRTFGNGQIGIDASELTGPALGKCPKRIWINKLGLKDSDNLEICRNKFIEMFTIDNKDIIKTIISGAVKNGPWCLPFVLIH